MVAEKKMTQLAAKDNEYIVSLIQTGDIKASEELISKNEGMVRDLAYSYTRMFESIGPYFGIVTAEILVELGHFALLRAAKRFNPDKGTSFYTYAYKVVKNKFREYCRKKCELTENKHIESGKTIVFLDEPVPDSDDFVSDTIPDTDLGFVTVSKSFLDPAGNEAVLAIKCRHLYMALQELAPHHRLIIMYLYGLIDSEYHTYDEAAKRYNTTKRYIINQEKQALKKLNELLTTWN